MLGFKGTFNIHPAPRGQAKTRLVIESKLLAQPKTGISFTVWMPDERASAAILTCKLEKPDGHVSQCLIKRCSQMYVFEPR